jgi:hypothetical protein
MKNDISKDKSNKLNSIQQNQNNNNINNHNLNNNYINSIESQSQSQSRLQAKPRPSAYISTIEKFKLPINSNNTQTNLQNMSHQSYKETENSQPKLGGKKQLERTKISQISEKTNFNLNEFEDNRTNNLIDKIIDVRKKANHHLGDKFGIENNQAEQNILKKIDKIYKKLSEFTIASSHEENLNFELVEKTFIDSLRKENDNFIIQNKNLNDKIAETKYNCRVVESEIEMLKQINEADIICKQDKITRLKLLESSVLETEEFNKKLQKVYKKEKMEKENKYLAIINLLQLKDKKLMEEFDEMYKSYNNQFFLATLKPKDEDLVEELLALIESKEKEIFSLQNNLINLDKLLVNEKKSHISMNSIYNSNASNLPTIHRKSISINKEDNK